MTYDTKNTIDNLSKDECIKLYKFIKVIIDSGRCNSSQKAQLMEILQYIENRLNESNIRISSGGLSQTDYQEAQNIFNYIGATNQTNNVSEQKLGFFDGFIGFVGFIAIIIVIAIAKGLFDVIVNLWNSGVLKVVLGLGIAGGGVYLGYKNGLFEKLKTFIQKNKEQNKINYKEKNIENSNSKDNEKEKQNDSKDISFVKEMVKALTVYSSAAVILGTGMAHLDKHTKVLDGTFLESTGNKCRLVYENVGRFAREKVYELTNDYSEFENNGYMNYLDPYYSRNNRNWNYENGDIFLHITHDRTWEWLSSYCYGNSKFSKHLRLYNSRYDLSDNIVHEGDGIFVPSPEKLEDYIYEKRLIKKR